MKRERSGQLIKYRFIWLLGRRSRKCGKNGRPVQ